MSKEAFGQFGNFNKVAATIAKRTTEHVAEAVNGLVNNYVELLKDSCEAKKPEEYFAIQARAASRFGAECLKNVYGMQKLAAENFADWNKLLENSKNNLNTKSEE